MAFPHRWNDVGFEPDSELHSGTPVYQGYCFPQADDMDCGGMRNTSFQNISHSHHLTDGALKDHQRPNKEPQTSFSRDLMSYPRTPSLVSEGTEMDCTMMVPTAVPQRIDVPHRTAVCRSNKPVKLCPLLTGETDVCQPDRCGPLAPCLDFTDLPAIEECISLPYMTPPIQESGNTSETLPMTARPRPRQRRSNILTPPVSRRTSTDTPQSPPSCDELVPNPTDTPLPASWPPHNKPNASAKQSAKIKTGTVPRPTTTATSQADKDAKMSASKLRARQAHSLVERRYRENLNLRISQLHESLQKTKYGPSMPEQQSHQTFPTSGAGFPEQSMSSSLPNIAYSPNLNTAMAISSDKIRKSDILDLAMVYIDHAETEMDRMNLEIQQLNAHIQRMQRPVGC